MHVVVLGKEFDERLRSSLEVHMGTGEATIGLCIARDSGIVVSSNS